MNKSVSGGNLFVRHWAVSGGSGVLLKLIRVGREFIKDRLDLRDKVQAAVFIAKNRRIRQNILVILYSIVVTKEKRDKRGEL